MKYILTEQQISSSYPDNILFVKYNLWNNSDAKRELPYPGSSAWAIRKVDLNKFLTFFDTIKELYPEKGGGSENIQIVNPSNKNIVALNYKAANNYVMGDSDEEPQIENFDPKQHLIKFEIMYQNPLNKRDKVYKPLVTHQVLLQ